MFAKTSSLVLISSLLKSRISKEEKFKTFYSQLNWALAEYDRIVSEVIPVTAMVLVSTRNEEHCIYLFNLKHISNLKKIFMMANRGPTSKIWSGS